MSLHVPSSCTYWFHVLFPRIGWHRSTPSASIDRRCMTKVLHACCRQRSKAKRENKPTTKSASNTNQSNGMCSSNTCCRSPDHPFALSIIGLNAMHTITHAITCIRIVLCCTLHTRPIQYVRINRLYMASNCTCDQLSMHVACNIALIWQFSCLLAASKERSSIECQCAELINGAAYMQSKA